MKRESLVGGKSYLGEVLGTHAVLASDLPGFTWLNALRHITQPL